MPVGVDGNAAEVSDPMSENEKECDEGGIKPDREEAEDHIMAEAPVAPSDVGADAPAGQVKKKYDPKDPSRPRRKKARRACFACQRAHLTCGKLSRLAWGVSEKRGCFLDLILAGSGIGS